MSRRAPIEVFGLSMLDTVTCGLGAAIVLLLFIASQIPPEAVISFTRESAVSGQSPATPEPIPEPSSSDRKNVIGIASVFLRFDAKLDFQDSKVTDCRGHKHDDLKKSVLFPPEKMFGDGDALTEWGFSVWWAGSVDEFENEAGCIRLTLPTFGASGCEYSFVADAYIQAFKDRCPEHLTFDRRGNDEGIYEPVP